ncbi:MAG: hypothetical protein A2Z73_01530 [Deltaproteobacteria bacterium RBG_13_60_28]|nr:MAG: hypothetical protein A2Z73_01530 [Deltaproteobacteria bacterium RBG_13_60_28]
MQCLHEKRAWIDVITSGNGLWYLRQQPEVRNLFAMESLQYQSSGGAISISRTLASLGDVLCALVRKRKKVAALVEANRPSVIVTDSEYTFFERRFRGIPVVALNNSDVVWHAYQKFVDKPEEIKAQFYAIEVMDFCYHRLVPSLVLSPTVDSSIKQSKGRFMRVGPIVRRGYEPSIQKGKPKYVVIMLSGSVFGSQVHLITKKFPFHIDIVGREQPPNTDPHPSITYHGKLMDNRSLLSRADLLVVNGGFSAVSEAFFMQKPMVVIPVPRHAEQWINGRIITDLGVGMMAGQDQIEEAIYTAIDRLEHFRAAYQQLKPVLNGAETAAQKIRELAQK